MSKDVKFQESYPYYNIKLDVSSEGELFLKLFPLPSNACLFFKAQETQIASLYESDVSPIEKIIEASTSDEFPQPSNDEHADIED